MKSRVMVALAAVSLLTAVAPAGAVAKDPGRFERIPLSSLPDKFIPGASSTAQVKVILELADQPVALHEAAARATGTKLTSAEKAAIRAQLKTKQDALKPALARVGARVLGQYQDAYDGVKIMVAAAKVADLATLPNVVSIQPVTVYERENLVGVPFVGGSAAWTDLGLTGAGVKIADIDTGIDYYHADFGGSGKVADYTYGFAHDTAFPATNADGTTIAFPNTKVTGGYDLVGDTYNADPSSSTYQPIPHPDQNPLDCPATTESVGHGTHTAGTAAGYGVLADGSTYTGPYTTAALESNSWNVGPGVAPKATILSFRVFGCQGSTDVVVDAIDLAVKAGVDVINMSLGSPFGPSDTADAVASNNAALAGVVVVASAGNDGPNPYIVGSPSTADRALSVAAIDPTASFAGASITTGAGTITMINANGAPGLPLTAPVHVLMNGTEISLGCQASDYAGTAGQIVVTQRGDCDRVARAKFGQAAGAAAVIMANQAANAGTLPPFEGAIPGVTIPFLGARYEDQAALKALEGQTVTIEPASIANPGFKKLAGFSSGGPASLSSALKPEITAPGVSTLSAESGGGTAGQRLSGTSMAAPFTTGSAALVVQAHPGWTPAQVKAALIDTADSTSTHILSYNVRTAGAGIVQVQKAASSVAMAWTLDGTDTLSFGYDPANAAFVDTKQLTITNSGTRALTYTFSWTSPTLGAQLTASPSSVTVPAGSSRPVNVKLTLSAAAVAALPAAETSNFGSLVTIRGAFTATPTTSGTGIYPLRVPFLAVPRGLSDVMAAKPGKLDLSGNTASGSVKLTNAGIHQGNADVYAWGLHDGSEGMPSNDIRDVGVQSLDAAVAVDPSLAGDRLLNFAISTYGRWSNPSVNEYDIPIDENGDGRPDRWVIGIDFGLVSSGTYNGQYVSIITDASFNILDAWVADAPMNGSTLELPALAGGDLGLTGAGSFSYGVTGFSAEGFPPDQVAGSAKFAAFAPALSQGEFVALDPRTSANLPLSVDVSKVSAQPALGWLVLTMDDPNGAAQADEVAMPRLPSN